MGIFFIHFMEIPLYKRSCGKHFEKPIGINEFNSIFYFAPRRIQPEVTIAEVWLCDFLETTVWFFNLHTCWKRYLLWAFLCHHLFMLTILTWAVKIIIFYIVFLLFCSFFASLIRMWSQNGSHCTDAASQPASQHSSHSLAFVLV